MTASRLTCVALLAVLSASWKVDRALGQEPRPASAVPPLAVMVCPEGVAADRLAARVQETFVGRDIAVHVSADCEPTVLAAPDGVARCIEVDLSDAEALWVRVRGLPDGPHARRVARAGSVLDESTLEAATTVIAMAAESFRTPPRAYEDAQEELEVAATHTMQRPVVPDVSTKGTPTDGLRSNHVASELTPPPRPLEEATSRHEAHTRSRTEFGHGGTEKPRVRRVATELSLGYEVVRWGPGLWPQGVLAGARVGPRASDFAVRVVGWATPTRAHFKGPPVLSLAVYGGRALCVFAPSLGADFALELGAGMGAYAVRAQAIGGAPTSTVLEASWQRSLAFHARLALSYRPTPRLRFSAAAGVDADRAQVLYGTLYRNGFAAMRRSSRGRPSLALAISLRF